MTTKPKDHELSARWLEDNDWNTHVRCPYCGERHDSDEHLMAESGCKVDGDSALMKCSECHAKFELSLSVSYYWRSEPVSRERRTDYVGDETVQRMWQNEHRIMCDDVFCVRCHDHTLSSIQSEKVP